MKDWSDDEIIFCLKGESEKRDLALKQMYTQLFPIIKSFIQKNNGSEDDAADIFQDAIIVFYEKIRLKEFKLSSSIRTYLYSVCKHLWLNKLRAQKKVTSLTVENESIIVDPMSLKVLGSEDRNEYLRQLMSSIGGDCKKVLIYYYYDRLKMKEIALRMNFATEQVAKNKKSSCLKKLKLMVAKSPRLKELLK
ncbi:MAG: sigma-70 family RNA polymerase sigma factor [Saprospiraceae bacterium]|nr:sigma-70 family RNA polymerase sigma factor [Saprospiraceae bacterium]